MEHAEGHANEVKVRPVNWSGKAPIKNNKLPDSCLVR